MKEQLATTQQEFEEAKANNQRWREAFKELEGERDNLQWEVGVQRDEKQRLQAENEALQEQLRAAQTNPHKAPVSPQQHQLPTALDLLNEFRKRRKKPTIGEVDIEIILDILAGENDDDYLPPNKEVKSLPESAPIEDLALSVRAYNCLKRAEINSIQQLLTHTPQSLLSIEKLGKAVLAEIESSLQERFGLSLASEEKNEVNLS